MALTPQKTPNAGGEHKAPPTGKERRAQAAKEQAEMDKKADEAAYKRATEGPDDETKEKLLALGADVTRASPAMEQNLGDPQPGLTTTSGAYRSPMDPTTADVPAEEDSEFVRRAPRGFPAIGKGKGDRAAPQSGTAPSHAPPPPPAR